MGSIYEVKNGYRARWRTPDGGERSKTFPKKGMARDFLKQVESAKFTGTYVDPAAGKQSFQVFAEDWRARQVHRPGTASQIETNFRLHVYPLIGHRPIGSVKTSEIQTMVRRLLDGDPTRNRRPLAGSTVRLIYIWVATMFKAAVVDRAIPASPCTASISLPAEKTDEIVPLAPETVTQIIDTIADRHKALVVFGAGTGVRISEALGVTNDRVDWMRRTVRVDRQLVAVEGGMPKFGPLKDKENRPRTIPLSDGVIEALAAHIAAYGLGPEGLIFTNARGGPLWRTTFSDIWRAAAGPLGVPLGDGFHQLRHFYASVLIEAGESVKTVQRRLGHKSATMTLDVYSHLWPEDEDRTRSAVDNALRSRATTEVPSEVEETS